MMNKKAVIITTALLLALLAIGSVSAADIRSPYEPSGKSKGHIVELQQEIRSNTQRIQEINREVVQGNLTGEEKKILLQERWLLRDQNFRDRQAIQQLSRQRN